MYGSLQDWDYTGSGCLDITLELSDDKFPPASTLASHWADNLDSLLALPITAVLGGVSGQVLDSEGNPVKGGTVTVDGITRVEAARGPLAYYNRPLEPGNYTLRAAAPGFRGSTGTVTVTVPASGQGVQHDFRLVPNSLSVSMESGRVVVAFQQGDLFAKQLGHSRCRPPPHEATPRLERRNHL